MAKKYLGDIHPINSNSTNISKQPKTIKASDIKGFNLSDKIYHLTDAIGLGGRNEFNHMYDDLASFGVINRNENPNGKVSYSIDPTNAITTNIRTAYNIGKGIAKQVYYKLARGQNFAARNITKRIQGGVRKDAARGISDVRNFFNSEAYRNRLSAATEYGIGTNRALRLRAGESADYVQRRVNKTLGSVNSNLDNIKQLQIRTVNKIKPTVAGSLIRRYDKPHIMTIYRNPINEAVKDYHSVAKHEAIHSTYNEYMADLNEGLAMTPKINPTDKTYNYFANLDEQRARILNVLSAAYHKGKDIASYTYDDLLNFANSTKNSNAQQLINYYDRKDVERALKYMVGTTGAFYTLNNTSPIFNQ